MASNSDHVYEVVPYTMILTVIMCTYRTGDNHSGPCGLGAGVVVHMYYSNLTAFQC